MAFDVVAVQNVAKKIDDMMTLDLFEGITVRRDNQGRVRVISFNTAVHLFFK